MKFAKLLSGLAAGGILVAALAGCQSLEKKKEKVQAPVGTLRDQAGDTSFQAFLSTLRKAAANKDVEVLAGMMTADFGYSWEPGGEGVGVFKYWTQHNLWGELNVVLKEKFVPSGDYMVAPAAVTVDPDFPGYRAGMRLVNGSWRFAYFVSAAPPSAR